MFLSALDSWSTNTVWVTILPAVILLSFSCQKPRGALIPSANEKANRDSGRPRRFAESGLGIRSSSLDSPPPRAGFEQVQIARFRWARVSVWWREERRSPARLSALRRRKVISRVLLYRNKMNAFCRIGWGLRIAIRTGDHRYVIYLYDASHTCRIVLFDRFFVPFEEYLMDGETRTQLTISRIKKRNSGEI